MAKSKYDTHVAPYLSVIKDWARNGATDNDIAKRLGISRDTLYEYKKQYPDFSDALKHAKDFCDAEIENALYLNAKSGNVIAQIFWLKNRRPTKWREQPTEDNSESRSKLDKLCEAISEAAEDE